MTLKSRNAVVTGSTSGIGLAYARALAREGANVCINGFGDVAAIEAERAGIERDFGVRCIYNDADMTKGDQIDAMVKDPTAKRAAGRHSRQQPRHPVRVADGTPRPTNGTRSSPSTSPPLSMA